MIEFPIASRCSKFEIRIRNAKSESFREWVLGIPEATWLEDRDIPEGIDLQEVFRRI